MNKLRIATYFLIIIVFTSLCCGKHNHLSSVEGKLIAVDSLSAPKDSLMLALIEPYKIRLDEEMNKIIGYSEKAMSKASPEGYLNNLIADIIFEEAKQYIEKYNRGIVPDICLLNMGGLRADLPEGAIKRSNIYEIMPFENEIVILEMSKEKVHELFDYIAANNGMPLSGAKMCIRKGKAVDIIIGDKPFENIERSFFVVTSDYLAEGGDRMFFFSEPLQRIETSYGIRDAIINYIVKHHKTGRKINSQLDKRIYIE